MAKKGGKKEGGRPIIIKREEVVEGGHHGGAWKVAYADFVTAMMAFFLLMWLLNATTEDQRKGLADYFAPVNALAHQTSGSGQPFGGHTPFDAGSLVSDRGAMTTKAGKATAMVAPDDAEAETSDQLVAPKLLETDGDPALAQLAANQAKVDAEKRADGQDDAAGAGNQSPRVGRADVAAQAARDQRDKEQLSRADAEKVEREEFQHAADQIREAIRADPSLASIAKQLAIDMTPEGLRVQILDEDKLPMFPFGSAVLNERGRALLEKIAPVLSKLSEPISITGHTDAAPYRSADRTNWELSSDRANATRRLLVENGLVDSRFKGVTGASDRDPLLPADPLAAANRRIAIVVLRTARPVAAGPAPMSGSALPRTPAVQIPATPVGAGAPAASAPAGPAPATNGGRPPLSSAPGAPATVPSVLTPSPAAPVRVPQTPVGIAPGAARSGAVGPGLSSPGLSSPVLSSPGLTSPRLTGPGAVNVSGANQSAAGVNFAPAASFRMPPGAPGSISLAPEGGGAAAVGATLRVAVPAIAAPASR